MKENLQDLLKNKKYFLILNIELALAILGIYGAAGYSDIEIPILLKEKKLPDILNSINYSFYLFTYTVGCLLVLPLFKKYSSRCIVSFMVLGFLISLLVFSFTSSIFLLITWYSIQGLCCAVILVIFSNVVTTVTNYQENKGVFTGIFVTITSLGYFLGAASVGFLNNCMFKNPCLIVTLIAAACTFPLFFSKVIHKLVDLGVQDITKNVISPLKSIKNILKAPICFFSIMIYGINSNIIIGLAPIWSLDQGNNPSDAATLTSVLLVGGIFLASFFSSIISHISFLKSALIYFFTLTISLLIMHFVSMHSIRIHFSSEYMNPIHLLHHPFLLIISGVICSFQALYLCILSAKFKGAALIGACASASFLQHFIATVTSPFSGYLMTKDGYRSLGPSLISLNLIFFLILIIQFFIQKKRKVTSIF